MPAQPLDVLFDAFWWVEGPYSNRQVMREFIFAWQRCFPADRLTLAVPQGDRDQVRADLGEAPVDLIGLRVRPHGLALLTELPLRCRGRRFDAVITHNFVPWPTAAPVGVFVHDVLFRTNPEWFTRTELLYFRLISESVPRARWVFSSSAAEAERIATELPRAPRPLPIGLALGPELAAATPTRPAALDGIERFVLAVGRINARKNLGRTIEAGVASRSVSPTCPLIIVGESQGKAPDLGADVAAAIEDGSVVFSGYLSEGELQWLYRSAALFVFLSMDEGFGLPLLEAARYGRPILASDIAVFREIQGSGARYVDPTDVPAIRDQIDAFFDRPQDWPAPDPRLDYQWEASARAMRQRISADLGRA